MFEYLNKSVHLIQSLYNFTGFYYVLAQHFRQNSILPVYGNKAATHTHTHTPSQGLLNFTAGSVSDSPLALGQAHHSRYS